MDTPPPRQSARGAADWLIALDDALCARLTHCVLCMHRGTGWFDIWAGPDYAVGFLLCRPCYDMKERHAALAYLMRQRYESPPCW
jgi:hypothetical protein